MTAIPVLSDAPQAQPQQLSTLRDYVTLLKPGVMALVVFTGFIGMVVAPGALHPFLAFIAVLSIALGSGAGAAINMWYDGDIDAVMKRTEKRPVPAGRVPAIESLHLGIILALVSVLLMGLATNWLAAGVLAFAIFFYGVIYTMWLKRRTPQNIVIGGAAGAFPPVIGWVAVTGSFSLEALVLFLIIFLWTPPHFWALALCKNEDYARAGVPMLPVVAGDEATRRQILLYTFLLIGASLLPLAISMAGAPYAVIATVLNAGFLGYGWRVFRTGEHRTAMRMFGYSIAYLALLFAALALDGWLATQLPV